MNSIKLNYIAISIVVFLAFTCSKPKSNDNHLYINDGDFLLTINTKTFQFQFENNKATVLAPAASSSGILIDDLPVVSAKLQKNSGEGAIFSVTNSNGDKAIVTVAFKNGIANISVNPNTQNVTKISLGLGGMSVAHGLGDAGAFRESFNLLENKSETYDIVNDGGAQRWASSFVIFPKNNLAGVFFNEGKKQVIVSEEEYTMSITKSGKADFYYMVGNPKSIYANYKTIRNQEGYIDVKPKSRLFELGWESWDALGWNTNQVTVQEILQKYYDNHYPIKWAVTGSGFWDQGGTTTSFGRWGKKFPEPKLLKDWMHSNDMKWMIGLRTNFIPEGGPYYPKTKKRNQNLKVNSFYGNELTTEAKNKGFLVSNSKGETVERTSEVFPIVPSNLLNGNIPGAAVWYQQQYAKWGIDGIKEDTMIDTDSLTGIYTAPITKIAEKGGLVMARNGEFIAGGTLLRINDTGVGDMVRRIPITYLQYAASGFPNVYSDVAGVHNMNNINEVDKNIRHTWLLSLTSGLAVGAYPKKWSAKKQTIFKKAIHFHYKLTPYMFSEARIGYETGYPTTLTPLTIAYPNDSIVSDLKSFQWMIGASILATPLLKNYESGKMDVYLPAGIWFDYETGKKYEGTQTLKDFEIPLDKTPIFIGGKGIIIERDSEDKPLSAKIYPISKKQQTYVFTYPEEKGQSKITYKIGMSTENIKVKDITLNKNVPFKTDAVSGSIDFEILPNHNYEVKEK